MRIAIAISPHANGMPHVHGEVLHHHDYTEAWMREWKLDYEHTVKTTAKLMELTSVDDIIAMTEKQEIANGKRHLPS